MVQRAGLAKLATNSTSTTKATATANMQGASRSTVLYGIGAKRSNQSIFNAKGYYSNNGTFREQRELLNQFYTKVNNYGPVQEEQKQDSSMDTLSKIMMYTALGTTGVSLFAGVAQLFKSSDKSSASSSSSSKDSTSLDDSLKNMVKAEDSFALNAAIENAKRRKNSIGNDISSAESELEKLKETTSGAESKMTQATNAYNIHIKETLPQAKAKLDSCQKVYDSIKNSMEAQVRDPGALEAAGKALEEAKKALEEANKQTEKLETEKEQAENKYKEAKDAQEAKDKELQNLRKTMADLEKEIPKQEKRLEKLKKEEASDLEKLPGKIEKLQNQVVGLNNKGKTDKAQTKQVELDIKKKRLNEVQRLNAIKNRSLKNGTGTVTYGGKTLYFIKGKEVTQEYYNQHNPKNAE